MDLEPVHADTPFQALSQAFIMIVVSEIGDKTFLIAAIMATRHPRLTVFAGAFASLLIMSVLSAAMGKVILGLIPKRWTEFVAALLFLVFGVRMLQEGLAIPSGSAHMQDEMREVEEELDEEELDRVDGKNGLSGKALFDAEEGRGGSGGVVGKSSAGGAGPERRNSGDVRRSQDEVNGNGVGLGISGSPVERTSTDNFPNGNGNGGLDLGNGGLAGNGKRKTPSISPNRHAMAFNAKSYPLSAPSASSSNPFSFGSAHASRPSMPYSQSSRTPFTSFLLSLRHKLALSGSSISLSSTGLDTKSVKNSVKNLMGLFFSPVFVQAFVLTFLGEWGDRSQIATIALGGANSVTVVAFGTILGHGLCTAGAVIGGRYLSTKISIRHITLLGAAAFLFFACIYAYEGWINEE